MRLHSAVIAMVATTAAAKECYLVTVTGRLAQMLISRFVQLFVMLIAPQFPPSFFHISLIVHVFPHL